MRWRKEIMVAGTNARMRRLLGADIVPARLPYATSMPQEVLYRSAAAAAMSVFVSGCGQTIPRRVTRWLDDGEGMA